MKRRLFYGAAVVALAILVTLVVWQGSFTFGEYAPASVEQTYLFWAVSTLIFLLMVTLGFMLFRTAARLYVERRSNRPGAGIKTKLVVGALALSFLPVFFLVLFSVSILNRNLDKWFSRPAQNVRLNLVEISAELDEQAQLRAQAQADWLAGLAEAKGALEAGRVDEGLLGEICSERGIAQVYLERSDGRRITLCRPPEARRGNGGRLFVVDAPVAGTGGARGVLTLHAKMPLDLAEKQTEIERHIREYDQLAINRKSARVTYLLLLALISLFILFAATWLALFMARQISEPVSALLEAAGRVREGQLGYRVRVTAIDELATLVRGFNEMTEGLEEGRHELERRRRFIETILENIPTGVISLTSEGRIQMVNRALGRILPEDRVKRAERLEDLFSPEDAAEIRYLMNRARRTGVASRPLELQSGKQALHLAATVSALEEKLTSGFVLVLEDTSELLRAQKAAAWHEVARRIAHEMKNPLTPIALCADRIARQLERAAREQAPPAEVMPILKECSTTIAKEVQSVKTLVDEFSQFARFPAAQPAPADLNEVVEEALAVFANRLDGIEVKRNLAEGLPLVNIDREQFKRVVVNLVDNSAEAMEESLVKRLYVSTQAAGADTVELTVADTGCGISPEEKEKLFLPYFSTKGRGTGLGLAIVNHILMEHGAQIRVEANDPAGARFVVEIPAMAAYPAERKPVESSL